MTPGAGCHCWLAQRCGQSVKSKTSTLTVGSYGLGVSVSTSSSLYELQETQNDQSEYRFLCVMDCSNEYEEDRREKIQFSRRKESAPGEEPTVVESGENVVTRYRYGFYDDDYLTPVTTPLPVDPPEPLPERPDISREQIESEIAAAKLHNEQIDSWWWGGTNTLLIEGQLALWGMQDSEYYDDSVKILQGEALYFLDTVTLGHAETGDYAQQLFDEAGIDRDLQMAPKVVANAGAAVTWVITGGLLIEAAGATAAGEGVVVYVSSSVSPAVLATTGDALYLLGTAYSTKSAIENILSGQYDEVAFDLAGYTASRAVGRQISKQFARPMTVEAKAAGISGRLAAGASEDINGLTKAGRALEKHGSRSGSNFPKATGNVGVKNAQGQQILGDLLRSNNQRIVPNRFGGQDIFDINTGRGVRFDGVDEMKGFLELGRN